MRGGHRRLNVRGLACRGFIGFDQTVKELFRERDFTIVGYYQTVLEGEGIATFVRNQDLTTIMTEVPIPDFFPALCVMNDEDFDAATAIIKSHLAPASGAVATAAWICPSCGEENPGTFEVCWGCGKSPEPDPA
jgi:hypothetical protein